MNKYLSLAVTLLTIYDELASGGAKAEADKLLTLAIQLGTAATAVPA